MGGRKKIPGVEERKKILENSRVCGESFDGIPEAIQFLKMDILNRGIDEGTDCFWKSPFYFNHQLGTD